MDGNSADMLAAGRNGRAAEQPNPMRSHGFPCRKRRSGTKMAKKPGSNVKGEFIFFDVIYEDGSQRSNRRVPANLLGGLEKDEPARGFIMEQDREIAEKSGRAPLAIKSIARSGAKKKVKDRERA